MLLVDKYQQQALAQIVLQVQATLQCLHTICHHNLIWHYTTIRHTRVGRKTTLMMGMKNNELRCHSIEKDVSMAPNIWDQCCCLVSVVLKNSAVARNDVRLHWEFGVKGNLFN